MFDILLIGVLITLIGRIWRKSESSFRTQFQRSSLIFGSITGFLSLLLLIFVILSNTFPSALSKITLSNGKRTIVFMEMSHIATPRFYETIRQDLERLTASGYTLYSE